MRDSWSWEERRKQAAEGRLCTSAPPRRRKLRVLCWCLSVFLITGIYGLRSTSLLPGAAILWDVISAGSVCSPNSSMSSSLDKPKIRLLWTLMPLSSFTVIFRIISTSVSCYKRVFLLKAFLYSLVLSHSYSTAQSDVSWIEGSGDTAKNMAQGHSGSVLLVIPVNKSFKSHMRFLFNVCLRQSVQVGILVCPFQSSGVF